MDFSKAGLRVMVRKDFGKNFDFWTEKFGLVVVYGDRNGPYTSFAKKVVEGEYNEEMSIFIASKMSDYKGYVQPTTNAQPDTFVATIPTDDIDGDYKRLKDAGVEFIGEPQSIQEWGMRCVYFRDPEGNLFELTDGNL